MTLLPDPSLEMLAHSKKLTAAICKEIAASGSIPFRRYMELALYAPGLGYYSAGLTKLGAKGDFVTAPEISPLFSRTLALQCEQILKTVENADILEFGAGNGVMAADLLLELEHRQCLPQHYYILEVSADLRQRQQTLLKQRLPQFYSRIQWLDQLPAKPFNGIILANEVLDAMPIQRLQLTSQQLNEYHVSYGNDQFIWQLQPIKQPELSKIIADYNIELLHDYYDVEINPLLPHWIQSLSKCLAQGAVFIIDYGFPRHEYYHPDRYQGTLMCHYQQRSHMNPLILTGLQDITAHVDFTAVAEAAIKNDFKVAGFTNQAAFLLSLGLLNLAELQLHTSDERQRLLINQQIQKLTSPAEMGELFKVMALTKNLASIQLLGFSLHDQRRRL